MVDSIFLEKADEMTRNQFMLFVGLVAAEIFVVKDMIANNTQYSDYAMANWVFAIFIVAPLLSAFGWMHIRALERLIDRLARSWNNRSGSHDG